MRKMASQANIHLLSKRKRILVLCPFPEDMAPAQRLKYEQYFEHWREEGYEVVVSPFMSEALYDIVWEKGNFSRKVAGTLRGMLRRTIDLLRIRTFDIVYVFLWVTPLGPPVFERLVRSLARRLVYDIDDNVHIGQDLHSDFDPNPIVRLLKGKSKPIYLMTNADFVITSSPFLEQDAGRLNRHGGARYVTSSVDTDHFVPRDRRPENPLPVIGWTGTFSSRPFLDMMAPMLRKLSERRQFEFRVVGNFDIEMPGVNLKVVRFDKPSEVEQLFHFDIGMYPLPDEPWVYGKSGLKAILYMAMGLPVVASDVGTTPLLYEHGDIGFLVRNEEEWIDALTRLIDDEALRAEQGRNARRVALAHYSRQAVRAQYLGILDSVCASSPSSAITEESLA